MPTGEAPEWVRQEWVGLELPLAENPFESLGLELGEVGVAKGVLGGEADPSNLEGYIIDTDTAVEILSEKSPKAADWWKGVRHLLSDNLMFGRCFCELIP